MRIIPKQTITWKFDKLYTLIKGMEYDISDAFYKQIKHLVETATEQAEAEPKPKKSKKKSEVEDKENIIDEEVANGEPTEQ